MRDRRLSFLWRAMGIFLLFMVVQNVVTVVIALVAAQKAGMTDLFAVLASDEILALLESWTPEIVLISDGLMVAVLLLWGRWKLHEPLLDYTGLRKPIGVKIGAFCVVAGVAANFWFAIAINLIPWPQDWITEYAGNASSLGGTDVLTILAVVLAAPICEELVFRGRIYGNLSKIIPAGAAVVMQAVLFGGLHAGKLWMLYAFCVGCVMGYIRKATGSVRSSLYMHISFNAASLLFDYFARHSGEDGAAITSVLVVSALVFLICIYQIVRHSRKEEAK